MVLKGSYYAGKMNSVKPEYRDTCFYGVGSDIPGPFWSSREAGEKCKTALAVSDEAYKQCVIGGMSFLVQINVGDPKAAVEYCDTVLPKFKDACYKAAGEGLRDWLGPGEKLAEKCKSFGDEHSISVCLNGK